MSSPENPEASDEASILHQNADLQRRLYSAERALAEHVAASSSSGSRPPLPDLRDDLAAVLELLPVLVCIATPEGQVVFINVAGCSLLGVDPAEVASLHLRDFHSAAVARVLMDEIIPAAVARGLWQGESTLLLKNGREIPVSVNVIAQRERSGRLRHLAITARDISERKMATDLLLEQSVVLANANEAIIELDLQGQIILWNRGAEQLYGWSAREAEGRPITELAYKDELVFHAAQQTTLDTGFWSGEVAGVTRSGQQVLTESRWSLIRDGRGQPRAFIAISSDITEKKRLASQFLRAQRMESIGTLAGGIAHDLNNVLAPILMGVGVLRMRITDEPALKLLDTFELSAKRGAAMVQQVLAFSRGIEGQRIPIAPSHLIHEVETLLQETLPKSIVVSVKTSKDDWPVLGDITQMQQVMLNLCVNARDAMPQGGRLTIESENVLLDEAYQLINPEAKPGPYVLIRVSDTGTGIPEEIRDKIFEPFFSTKEVGKGTGLGLSTTYSIVKSHGGFIHLYSEFNRGTTFKVYLPAQPAGQILVQPISEQRLPRGNGDLLLVVDDEEIILETAKTVLERSGYRVLLARDGAEGVALYVQNMDAIAAVITDITMPIMDGIATMRAIKSIRPAARIICASGLASNRQLTMLADAGMSHFIAKPFTAEALLQTIHKTITQSADFTKPA